jgi:hypothetical protein
MQETSLERERETIVYECVYYETIKQELNRRLIYECRCDERLKAKVEGFTHLGTCRTVVYYETIKRDLNKRHI